MTAMKGPAMTRTKDHLRRLDVDECLRLLEGHPTHVGRVVFLDQGYPVALPVNYRIHRGTVVFRTDPGSKLLACAMGDKIAFEVDDVDARWREGWSVLLQGVAREVTDPEQKSIIDQIGLLPWAGAEAHTIELEWHRISGRQIV